MHFTNFKNMKSHLYKSCQSHLLKKSSFLSHLYEIFYLSILAFWKLLSVFIIFLKFLIFSLHIYESSYLFVASFWKFDSSHIFEISQHFVTSLRNFFSHISKSSTSHKKFLSHLSKTSYHVASKLIITHSKNL